MDKWIDSKNFMVITALLLAILLFFTIKTDQQANDLASKGTQADVIRDVPVEVYYDDDTYVVTGIPETVDVRIQGPPAIVQSARALRDFSVFIDLRDMSLGEHVVTLQHENISTQLQASIDPVTVKVNIEEKVTKEFRVEPEINKRLLAENYVVTEITTDTDRIMITGAKSIIESISFVKASVTSKKDLKESFVTEANVRVLDRDLNKLNVSIEPDKVNVRVKIDLYSKVVPLEIQEIGELPENVSISELKLKETSIRVFGSKAIIDALQFITVEVDLSKLTQSATVEGILVLPTGVEKTDPNKVEVDVVATNSEDEIIKSP